MSYRKNIENTNKVANHLKGRVKRHFKKNTTPGGCKVSETGITSTGKGLKLRTKRCSVFDFTVCVLILMENSKSGFLFNKKDHYNVS